MIREVPSHISVLGVTQQEFKKNQKRDYDKLAFEMYVKSIKMSLEVTFILFQFMPFIWERLIPQLSLDASSEFQRGLAFVFAEALRNKTIDVPNSLYHTFVIEKRYNPKLKTTFGMFFFDLTVECFLVVMIIPVFLYGYLKVVEFGGEYFFLYMQLFILVIIILLGLLYPNLIAPLLNKFEELEEGALKYKIKRLADQIGFPLQKILVMDGSKRSDHSNAYFFGLWNNKRIVLYDTLLKKLDDDEVVAVVGHELGHWKYRHPYINVFIFIMRILIIFYVFSFFRNADSIYISFGFSEKSIFIGSALFWSLFEPINNILQLMQLIISRFFEFHADQFAYKLGLGEPLISGLIKNYKGNATNLMVDPWYVWYYNSHPTIFERLHYIQTLINKRD